MNNDSTPTDQETGSIIEPGALVQMRALPGLLATPSLPLLLALAVTISYAGCAVLAWKYFPTAYSPLHNNTLSQLGNRNLNPHGSVFYLLGCALSGTFAIAFFLSISPWRFSGTQRQNQALRWVQIFGVVGGFGLIMNAVYPENQLQLHHFWSWIVFNGLGFAMFLSPFAFWRRGPANISVTVISILVVVTLLVMIPFAHVHWVEWVPITLLLISPAVVGFHTRGATLRARDMHATRASASFAE